MVVVFGGSFNPPTLAHKYIAEEVIERFKPESFIFVPVGDDYNKQNLVDVSDRINMLKLLTDGIPNIIISDIESKVRYEGTLHMLDELSRYYSDLYFLMGSDQIPELDKWINAEELLRKYHFIVVRRGETAVTGLMKKYESNFTFLDLDYDISATMIRNDLENGKMYTTDKVYEYIIENNLYR